MITVMRQLFVVAVVLCAARVHALPVNVSGTTCECYFDTDCPDTPEGKGVCWYQVGCDDTTRGPIEKMIDGMCGTIGPGGGGSGATVGSSCGEVTPGAVAKVLKAWTTAFDRAGASGGGPIGRFSVRAYRLSHLLIPSIGCRFEIARKALDLQVLSRSLGFLEHPDVHHRVEDHIAQDISADKCRQQIGRISSKAVQLEIIGEPVKAAEQLSQIPAFCPAGQTLGGNCEGAVDELACLGERLQVMAQFFATAPQNVCGDGIVAANEQCELDQQCGDNNRCLQCRCVGTVCALALCGNGVIDPGEECDDGNTNDNDRCVSCKNAVCGDAAVCNDPSCTSGPGGAQEQCDPPGPDTTNCFFNCLADCSCEIIITSEP